MLVYIQKKEVSLHRSKEGDNSDGRDFLSEHGTNTIFVFTHMNLRKRTCFCLIFAIRAPFCYYISILGLNDESGTLGLTSLVLCN